ncbi:hypothetical protein D3C71_644280 [compost metagenome]
MKIIRNITKVNLVCVSTILFSCRTSPTQVISSNNDISFYEISESEYLKESTNTCYKQIGDSDLRINGDKDLIVCISGQENKTVHYRIKDSTLYVSTYKSRDSLILESIIQKKWINKVVSDTDIKGFYQVVAKDYNSHGYRKQFSYYKNSKLLSRVIFSGVPYSDEDLPKFQEIKPLLDALYLITSDKTD